MRHEVYCHACGEWIDTREVEVKEVKEKPRFNFPFTEEYMIFSCENCESDEQQSSIRIGY